jgi:hypothetical protein
MPSLVNDEMLATFAVLADTPEELAATLKARYQSLANRITPYTPFTPGKRDDFWRALTTAWYSE